MSWSTRICPPVRDFAVMALSLCPSPERGGGRGGVVTARRGGDKEGEQGRCGAETLPHPHPLPFQGRGDVPPQAVSASTSCVWAPSRGECRSATIGVPSITIGERSVGIVPPFASGAAR